MTKFIKCHSADKDSNSTVRVKVIKAPLVDNQILQDIIMQRQKATVI